MVFDDLVPGSRPYTRVNGRERVVHRANLPGTVRGNRATSALVYRTMVAVDVEQSTMRSDPAKARLRGALYSLIEIASRMSGIADRHRDPLVDRGDGTLALFHPADDLPKTLLLNKFVPGLSRLLTEYNARNPDHGFRLRVAIHAGEVHYDRRGPFGEAVDITCRLLDARELKRELGGSTAPLVLVVSQHIYESIVRHGYHGIDPRAFAPLVRVELAGRACRGWVTPAGPHPR